MMLQLSTPRSYLLDNKLERNTVQSRGVARKVEAWDDGLQRCVLVLVHRDLFHIQADRVVDAADRVAHRILLNQLAIVHRECPQLLGSIGRELDF